MGWYGICSFSTSVLRRKLLRIFSPVTETLLGALIIKSCPVSLGIPFLIKKKPYSEDRETFLFLLFEKILGIQEFQSTVCSHGLG